jgi:parallel beta-helix repeat protein
MPYTRTSQARCAIPHTLALLIFLAFTSPGRCKVVYVNKNAPGATHNGASWSTAFTSVQSGIAAAISGDEVWVAAGTYPENITLKAGTGLYGGFAGAETDRTQRKWRTNVIILDGSGNTNTNVVSAPDEGSVLDGFTVRNGGNGIYVSYAGKSVIANCTISGNSQSGVYISHGKATIDRCTIRENNIAIFAANSPTATIANSTISGNTYGANLWSSLAILTNCTITANNFGIWAWGQSTDPGRVTISNCIVAYNEMGVQASDSSLVSTELSHNDVYGNTSANYTGLDDPTGTNGNISRDPRLSDIYRDLHIQPASPCVDAGDDSVVQAASTDIDGQPRIIGPHVDIGADECDGTVWTTPSRTWYVSPSGTDANAGTSWSGAKQTIGAALAAAEGSDEVWVAKGTFAENVTLPPGVSLYGGFSGAEATKGQRDPKGNPVVLSGNGSYNSCPVILPFEGSILDGFTVSNSAPVGSTGVYVQSASTVANCVVSGNVFGISVSGGWATIRDCVLSRNYYGVYVNGTASIANCTVSDNSVGIYAYDGTASISNTIVALNATGVQRYSTGPTIILSHNDVYGNTTASYGDVTDPTGTNGNISADPLFVNRTTSDYHLLATSPCINAGDDSAVHGGDRDLDGKPRIIGARVDIGAYEFGTSFYTVADAAKALRIAAGLETAPSDISRWDVTPPNSRIDLQDVLRIARMAAAFDPNP